jgi:hypothetical protein
VWKLSLTHIGCVQIQARLGNRPAPAAKEAGAASKYRDEEELAQEQAFKKWENAVIDKFDELQELDDENVLLAFREKRLRELQAKAARAKFGELIEIHEPDYVAEVTAQRDCFVVVFLFKVGVPRCDVLEAHLRPVAAKYKSTKFVKIRSESAIRGYPDSNLPTLLVYYNGEIATQIVGLGPFGGESMTTADVEWALHKIKAIEDCELTEDPRETARKERNAPRNNFVYAARARRGEIDSDEDDDNDRVLLLLALLFCQWRIKSLDKSKRITLR